MAHVTYRSLEALAQTASSSRVLNLNQLDRASLAQSVDGGPFFQSRALDRAILIKHRLRSNETQYLESEKRNVTKVVIPLSSEDLRLGGQSFFVNQKAFRELVASFQENNAAAAARDMKLLKLLDDLPSLDPFLLKELLERNGFKISSGYFAISQADQKAMNDFVVSEIEPLVRLSFGELDVNPVAITRIARKVLTSTDDAEIAPIREAFRMTKDEYRVRAFSWKGFLYYKWKLRTEMPLMTGVAKRIREINLSSLQDQFLRESILTGRKLVVRQLHASASEVFSALRQYENAFTQLVKAQDVAGFQSFLTMAPPMFFHVGVRLGVMSHIHTYWNFRYPPKAKMEFDFEELNELLMELAASLEFDPFEKELSGVKGRLSVGE